MNDLTSIVQSHYHSQSYINFVQGNNQRIFAMQVGCGIDSDSFAFAYAKNFPRLHLNCGVLIDGTLPILEYM
jgi:hypothetical protein